MELFLSIIRDYMVCIITCICFLVFLKHNNLTSRRIARLLMLAAISILIVIAGEIGERYFSELAHPSLWRVLFSVAAYSFRPAIPYFISLIPLRGNKKTMGKLMAIPLVLNMLICSTAFFCPVVFSYNLTNNFIRGPLGYFPFLIGALYIATIIISGIEPTKRGEYDETVLCMIVVIGCSASVIVEYTHRCISSRQILCRH